jgi:UPF0755 protein
MNKYNNNRRPNPSQSPLKSLVFLVLTITALAIAWNVFGFFGSINSSPASSPKQYSFEVKAGDNFAKIGNDLQKNNVINSPWSLQYLSQTSSKFTLLPGKYSLELPAKPELIMNQIKEQSEFYGKVGPDQKKEVKVTIKEGETVDQIIEKLSKAGVANMADLKAAVNQEGFKQKYEFLPNKLSCNYGQMQTCAKYYLEGYLYPDTYSFYANSGASSAIEKLLINFQNKVWTKVKSQLASKDFGQVVIMASVIEKETGRPIEGINPDNLEQVNKEKSNIASVFYNRLENNMNWASDPTASYGTGKNLCQQTLVSQTDCLYLDSPEATNKYNTYTNFGYPIAPIATPTVGSVLAALKPIQTDDLFFVSDASGKKYFSESGNGHDRNIAMVQEINKKYRN